MSALYLIKITKHGRHGTELDSAALIAEQEGSRTLERFARENNLEATRDVASLLPENHVYGIFKASGLIVKPALAIEMAVGHDGEDVIWSENQLLSLHSCGITAVKEVSIMRKVYLYTGIIERPA